MRFAAEFTPRCGARTLAQRYSIQLFSKLDAIKRVSSPTPHPQKPLLPCCARHCFFAKQNQKPCLSVIAPSSSFLPQRFLYLYPDQTVSDQIRVGRKAHTIPLYLQKHCQFPCVAPPFGLCHPIQPFGYTAKRNNQIAGQTSISRAENHVQCFAVEIQTVSLV